MELWQLKQRQSLPLAQKVRLSEIKIEQWYNHWRGEVYVSFSGGKDSTVLLNIIRSMYKDVPAVFVDTGLEYPEIRNFVKTIGNVVWVSPDKTFKQVIEQYGYPVISKEVSQKIHEAKTTRSEKLLHKRLYGDNNKYKSGRIPFKWQFLIKSPLKISHRCCHYLKKRPLQQYEKKSKLHPFVGLMACNSHARKQKYLKSGCNSFESKNKTSSPMAFWLEEDVWKYIKTQHIEYSTIYDMGYQNTGCMFCMFGAHLEGTPNKFQLMKQTHPKLWQYCIKKLGCGRVLDSINVKYDWLY